MDQISKEYLNKTVEGERELKANSATQDASGAFESPPPLDAKLQKGFGDCYRWDLTPEEYKQWVESRSSALRSLRVLNSGIFIEAHGHFRERSNRAEGILIYCTEGMGCYIQNNEQWAVRPGDLLYCQPLSHHRYQADVDQPWTIYWMHLSGELLAEFEALLGLDKSLPVRQIGIHRDIIVDWTRLMVTRPFTVMGDLDFFAIQANAYSILGRIAALPQNIADVGLAYGSIQKAISMMNESIHQPFNLDRFASEAGFSRRHFTRQFQRITGLPPGSWFIQQKMRRACSLLSLPQAKVKDVSNRLGYEDALYFSRIFKKVIGVPPDTYHKNIITKRSVHESLLPIPQ